MRRHMRALPLHRLVPVFALLAVVPARPLTAQQAAVVAPEAPAPAPAPALCIGAIQPRSEDSPPPEPLKVEPVPPDTPIDVSSDDAILGANGNAELAGNVRLKQGDREIRADKVSYDALRQSFDIEGKVEYHDPLLNVRGDKGRYSQTAGAEFSGAEFEIPSRPARGTAGAMSFDPQGRIGLENVAFTTCPLDDKAWKIQAREITLDTRARQGVGRDARVEFKGVPILYTPWISFPLGSERKSGFMFPSLGYSSRSGAQASIPYYWNIAPNYDLTAEPVLYSRRGIDFAGEFRYLTQRQRGELEFSFLPNDKIYEDDRSFVQLDHVTKLPAGWRAHIDASNVSDSKFFEDFGQGPEGTSTIFLERLAEVTYRDEHWRIEGSVQDFQTLDQNLSDLERPYSTLPRLRADGDFTLGGVLSYGFDSEAVSFDRNEGVTGWRFDALPHVGLEWDGPGYFVRPSVAWRWTQYNLDDVAPGADDAPSRTLPTASIDAGLVFEGPAGSQGQRRITLEPRLLYVYTPYRNQDELPVFDTAVPDLNLVQLFRTNRYVGADRVSDANQASLGVTSRLLDTKDGRQYLAVTLGQTYYFEDPRVRLPSEPVRERSSSDFVAQLAMTAFQNWSADFGVQWNPDESERERMQARLQYRPNNESVINVGYRFQQDRLDQAEASAAWPIGNNWSVYARYVHSLEDDEAIDQFAGLEYRACCWRARALARRFVSSQTGEQDTGIYLQLELSGLASVGSSAAAFLERAIRGYSREITTP